MNEQLALFKTPAPPPKKYRLFAGIFPSPEAVESMGDLQVESRNRFGLKGKFRPREILHVTLHHIGDYSKMPERVISEASKACTKVFAQQAAFEVSFDRVKSFRQGAFVLVNPDGNQLVKEVHHRLITELAKENLASRGDFKFEPHITLLYDLQILPEQPVPQISWRVNEVVLILSHLGETRYDRLQCWPLSH